MQGAEIKHDSKIEKSVNYLLCIAILASRYQNDGANLKNAKRAKVNISSAIMMMNYTPASLHELINIPVYSAPLHNTVIQFSYATAV